MCIYTAARISAFDHLAPSREEDPKESASGHALSFFVAGSLYLVGCFFFGPSLSFHVSLGVFSISLRLLYASSLSLRVTLRCSGITRRLFFLRLLSSVRPEWGGGAGWCRNTASGQTHFLYLSGLKTCRCVLKRPKTCSLLFLAVTPPR